MPKTDDPGLPWMPWFPTDFLSSSRVQRMTLEEQGAYRRLLDFQWMDGGLPTDMEEIARLIGVSKDHAIVLWKRIGPCFEATPLGLQNPRLEEERRIARDMWLRRSNAGKAGAAGRWGRQCDRIADAMAPTTTTTTTSTTTVTPTSENDTPPSAEAVGQQRKEPEKKQRKPPAGDHARVISFYCDEYAATQGTPYIVNGGRDGPAVKRLLKDFPPEEIEGRAARFLRADDEFLNKTDRSLSLFAQQFNRPCVRGVEIVSQNGHGKLPRAMQALKDYMDHTNGAER